MSELVCDACFAISPATQRFCGQCGTRFAGRAAAELAPETMLAGASGELKQVTVLFADLVDSTGLVAPLDPEAAMMQLQPVLRTMCEWAERFGGTVVNTAGDGIMALFGAPLAQERHAVLACQAALAMRDALRAGPGGHSIRGGLHSGPIVANAPLAGAVNSGAYGMTLHVASRLAGQVEPDQICVSEACWRQVRAQVIARALGARSLRGVPAPMALYELQDMAPVALAAPFGSGAAALPASPLLGRQNELAMLRGALTAAAAGAGGIVGISGAPGTGKSRLCHEFGDYCRKRMIPVFEARAQPYGAATPLRPVVALLRAAYFGLALADDSAAAGRTIADRLSQAGVTLRADQALFCEFLGAPAPHAWRDWMSPAARTASLLATLARLVRARGSSPAVLLLEDLHWLDEDSERFVAALAQALLGTKTMLVANYRPGYHAEWLQGPHGQTIELSELNLGDTGRLVVELLGGHPDLAAIRDKVALRSGGNPFFAEELARSLAEEGVLAGHPGAYRLGKAAPADVLPATLQVVIDARIDRLPAADRALLHLAAIIGKEFDADVLGSVMGMDPGGPAAALRRLCDAGMLQPGAGDGSGEHRFRHPLIQEVAYATQLRTIRSEMHAAVAQAMAVSRRDRLEASAGLISYHFECAERPRDAALYAAKAAHWVGLTSSKSAIAYWRKVRALMADQPRSRENDALRIEAGGQIAWLGWREGLSVAQVQPIMQESLRWARETDDPMISLLALADGRLAQVGGGDCDRFVEQVRDAIAIAEQSAGPGRVALLQAALSHAYGWAGLLREALAASDAAMAGLPAVTDFDQQFLGYSVEHWAIGLRGRILLRLGEFDAAKQCFDRLIGTPERIDATVLFIANFGYVELARCLGDAALGSEHAAVVAALADTHGSSYLRLYQLALQAVADGTAGKFDRATSGVIETLAFVRQAGAAVEYEPELYAYLAEYQMGDGAYTEAWAATERAIATARERHCRLPLCRALITQAQLIVEAGGDHAAAAEALAEAAALIEQTGAAIYQPSWDAARALIRLEVAAGAPGA